MNKNIDNNYAEVFPFKCLKNLNLNDLRIPQPLKKHKNTYNMILIQELKNQQKIINYLLKERQKNNKKLFQLYNYINSNNFITQSNNNDIISFLLSNIEIIKNNTNSLKSVSSSFKKNT